MGYFKRLETSGSVSLEAFKMYYVMRASAPSLDRESTDSLISVRPSEFFCGDARIKIRFVLFPPVARIERTTSDVQLLYCVPPKTVPTQFFGFAFIHSQLSKEVEGKTVVFVSLFHQVR